MEKQKKFRKSYLNRIKWEILDGKGITGYEYERVFLIEDYRFIISNHCIVEFSKGSECIGLIHFGDFNLPNEFELLVIANNIINQPIEDFSFQNVISEESGYLKVSDKYYLTDCD